MDESNFICKEYDGKWFLGDNLTQKSLAIKDVEKLPSTLVIPRTINGHEIDAIGQFSFYKLFKLEEVIIACQPSIIYRFAFSNLYNLKYIYLPRSLITLETNAITAVNTSVSEEDTEEYSLTAKGILTIVFPPHSKIKNIAWRSMTRKELIQIFYWRRKSPTYTGTEGDPFYTEKNVSVIIHAPYISSFCGFKTNHIYTCKVQIRKINLFLLTIINILL